MLLLDAKISASFDAWRDELVSSADRSFIESPDDPLPALRHLIAFLIFLPTTDY